MIELLLEAERALEMGRVDAAETLYQQVADADPRNAIAVVGLARVTLERGDELGAYLTARRALTIDPENAAAGRMVERLWEVMHYRGDAVPDELAPPDAPEPLLPDEPAPNPAPAAPPAARPAAPRATSPASRPRRSLLDRLLRRRR